ncbi:MAG: hypothetical protein FJZ47_10630, partial [Candidatus Tectomicrobia bacterium]|nr:hypothetical protein [Candidatus Tectomicrobia bacterium]
MSPTWTIALLKTPWTIGDITAPGFIWCAALLIVAATLACLSSLWWLVRREERIQQRLTKHLTALHNSDGVPQRDGMAVARHAAMAQAFEQVATVAPALGSAWRRFDTQLVVRRDTAGQESFWAPASATEVFNEASVIEPRVKRGFFAAIPSVATGAGLLCTFLAILIALLDVTLENEQFRGLDMLISGLSGKFLSSIAALSMATLYVLCERRLAHRLSQSVHALAVTVDELVPRLTPAR